MTSSAALCSLAAIFVLASSSAPSYGGPPRDWEPVPPEELALERSTVEPGADAEAIFWKMRVEDTIDRSGLSQSRYHYRRLKVFTPAGAAFASKIDIDVPLENVRVSEIQARTVHPDGSIDWLDRKAVFGETLVYEDNVTFRRYSLAPPAVRPGSIVELRYREMRFGEAAVLQEYPLQLPVPLKHFACYTKPIELPDWSIRQMSFHTTARTAPAREGGYYVTTMNNQRAYRDERDTPPHLEERPWMLIYYTQDRLTSPGAYWPEFGRDRWEWFDAYSKPDKATKALATEIVGDAATDLARIERMSMWLKREFRVPRDDSEDSGIVGNRSARDALRQRAGTAEDADAVFAALARSIGLEVRLVQAPSRSRFFFDVNMMSGAFLPETQVAVLADGHWRCFDPAARYLPWNMVPWREEAQVGLFCDRDSSRFIETPISAPELSRISRRAVLTLGDDGSLEGDVTLTVTGHLNDEFRSAFHARKDDSLDSTLVDQAEWSLPGLQVSRTALTNPGVEHAPLEVRFHARLTEYATVTDKRVILEPAAFQAHEPTRYTSSVRTHPVYFEHAWSESDSIAIRLPKGWTIETIDAPEPVRSPGVADYTASVAETSDGVVFRRSFRFGEDGGLVIPTSGYPAVKRLFDLVHERDRAAVTLVRAEAAR